jgi:porphobilinogen deaminase
MSLLRIGSRGSKLALWQANHVSDLLRGMGHEVEIEVIKTTGDKILDVALAKVGTKGMFTKEIEEALEDRRVDLAVRSSRWPQRWSAKIHETRFFPSITNLWSRCRAVRTWAPAACGGRRS